MPAVSQKGKQSTGHGCFAPTVMAQTPVSKTYFNGILAGVVDQGCQFVPHTCGIVTHSQAERYVSSGASKTYIEGKKAARIGDNIGCGDVIAEGSSNSFIE
jgi:uncharacterized Zn-binding protein involved in type VI secretion